MGIIDDVVGGVETVVEDVEKVVEVVVEGAEKVFHEVVDGIDTAVHEVEKFAETIVVDVVQVVEEAVDEVVQVEKSVEHFAEGVIHEVEDVVHGAEQLGENVIHEIGDVVHDVERFAETTFRAVVGAAEKLINIAERLLIVAIVKKVGGDPDAVIKEGIHLPTVDIVKVTLAGLTLEEVKIAATLLLTNPNSIPLPLVQMSSSIVVDGKTVASFDAGVATIAAHGSGNVDLLLALNYFDLLKDVAYDVATGIVKFTVKVELTLEIPNDEERHVLPFEWDVELPLPLIPFLALAKVGFKPSSSGESTDVALYLSIDNPNAFDMHVNSLRCEVSLDGVVIGSVELKEPAGKIPKRKVGGVKIPFSFNPNKFGQQFCQKLNGRSIGYSLQGTIDVQTPYGPMKMPIVMKDKAGTSIPLVNEPSTA